MPPPLNQATRSVHDQVGGLASASERPDARWRDRTVGWLVRLNGRIPENCIGAPAQRFEAPFLGRIPENYTGAPAPPLMPPPLNQHHAISTRASRRPCVLRGSHPL